MVLRPTSRAAWKNAAGAAEIRAGSIAQAGHPIPFDEQPEQSDPPESDQPPISTLGRPTTPRGAPEQPMQRELLVVANLHSCAVPQGGRDLQADSRIVQ
jgi:hypothetical protein